MDDFTFDWGTAVALVIAGMVVASVLVVAIAAAVHRRRNAIWSAAPAPATSWDEHTATAMAVLDPDALWDHLDQGVAAGAEDYLRRVALNHRKES